MHQRNRKIVEVDEVAFFEKYYEEVAYNQTGWRLRLKRELRSLQRASGMKPLKRVLSIGCGDGQFELMLAPVAEHITALDISPKAIAIAQQQAAETGVSNIDFKCLSISQLNWDEQFDAIICLAFLHHVHEPDLYEFLEQIYKHLKPGGFFYSQDPNIHGVLRKVGRILLGTKYDRYHTPDERELDPQEVAALLRSAGFADVNVGYIDLMLIPALFVLAKRASWPLYLCLGIDWLWCRSPLARWASGFTAMARKNVD
jgi:2-polyprenyl-3-methyl-5-hydroxy-6-metoxy-1,4-benzoquinol methylase